MIQDAHVQSVEVKISKICACIIAAWKAAGGYPRRVSSLQELLAETQFDTMLSKYDWLARSAEAIKALLSPC